MPQSCYVGRVRTVIVMIMFGDHKDPAPYVPPEALYKPAGAAVDAEGQVACVTCQTRVPVATADVVGMGYRCAACSHKAEIARLTGGGDAASHFSANERQHLASAGMVTAIGGGAVILLGVALIAFARLRYGALCVVGGISMIGVGLTRRSAAH